METTNITKLKQLGILGEIRQRLGAENENDTSMDSRVNKLSNHDLTAAYCGWCLGSESWWNTLKVLFDSLERFDEEA